MTQRYYIGPNVPAIGERVELDPEESHHLVRVMRTPAGALVRVFGEGREFEARVKTLRPRVVVQIERQLESIPPLRVRLHVAIPWLRGGRTELLVQKLTELGVQEISVYHAERCVAHGTKDKVERLERVAIESCKQCERADIPLIRLQPTLRSLLEYLKDHAGSRLLLAERTEAPRLQSYLHMRQSECGEEFLRDGLALISGPEGGLSPGELTEAEKFATFVSLGPRILRADFAPLVAVAVILAEVGEL
jgi:16S rRNA (uracil1498-N3)-methyltransferase